MAKAKKLPSGNWRVNQFIGTKPDGKKQFKSFTAPTRKEAEYMAASYLVGKREAVHKPITVGEAIDQYINNKDAVLSPSTVREYKMQRKRQLKGIMDIPINKLTQADIQAAINFEAKESSPKTVRNAHGLLSAALKEIAPDFILNTKLPAKKKTEIAIPTDEQVKEMLAHSAKDPNLYNAILLASCAGLRRSEICALLKEDIDTTKSSIRINKAVVLDDSGEWVIKGTKTYTSYRILRVPKSLVEMVIFQSGTDRIVNYKPNALNRRYAMLQKELNVGFRFHDLRHYYASTLLAIGMPDKYAMQQMGHSTTNMLKNVYQHVMENKMLELEDKLVNHFDGFLK